MNTATQAAPALLDIRAAAALAGISGRHLEDLAREGLAPAPLRLGRCRRWREAELREWIEAGCPEVGTAPAARK